MWLDVGVALLVLGLSVAAALVRRRPQVSVGATQLPAEGFFLAGRQLSWPLGAASIAATIFAVDTPFWIAALSYEEGLSAHWFWWIFGVGKLAGVFFFAPLWRRSGLRTDIEFVELRYGKGPAARSLRVLRLGLAFLRRALGIGIHLSVFQALLLAVLPSLGAPVGLPSWLGVYSGAEALTLAVVLLVTVYAGRSGLLGVVRSDGVQLLLAVAGSWLLLAVVISQLDSSAGATLQQVDASRLAYLPWHEGAGLSERDALLLLGFGWWSAVPGQWFVAQRWMAARDEAQAAGGALAAWFWNYALRSWPWMLLGVLACVLYPQAQDPQQLYVRYMVDFAPPGLRGLLLGSLLAAFMSTLDSYLNALGAYLLFDGVYAWRRRPLAPRTEARLVRGLTLLLALLGFLVSSHAGSIASVLKYLWTLEVGAAALMILRWYWWRVSAGAELLALGASLIISNTLHFGWFGVPACRDYALKLSVTLLVCTLLWVAYVCMRRTQPNATDRAFAKHLRLGGPGWARVWTTEAPVPRLWQACLAWLLSAGVLYGCLIAGLAALRGGAAVNVVIALLVAMACGLALGRLWRGQSFV